jgi:hypothetical protein
MTKDTEDYEKAAEYQRDYPDIPVDCQCGFEGEMYDLKPESIDNTDKGGGYKKQVLICPECEDILLTVDTVSVEPDRTYADDFGE